MPASFNEGDGDGGQGPGGAAVGDPGSLSAGAPQGVKGVDISPAGQGEAGEAKNGEGKG